MPISLAPIVKFSGQQLANTWIEALIDLRVEREFQVPGRCTLRFVDPGYALLASGTVTLGMPIVISAADGGELIEAEVTSISAEQREAANPQLVVVGHDKSHRMGRPTVVTTYQQMAYSDVVSKVVSSYGLTAATDSTQLKLEYLLQVDSDLGLVTEMARRAGFDWWVEGKTFNFKKPAAGTTVNLTLHQDLRSFSVRASGHYPDEFTVDGWDRKQQAQVTATAQTSSAAIKASSNVATLVASPKGKFGQAKVLTAGIAASNQDEATQLSVALAQRAASSAVTARGVADGSSQIKPGVTVKVTDAGPLSGTYPVTKVEHVYSTGTAYLTKFVAGDRRPTSLVDMLAAPSAAPTAATAHAGLVVGEVTNINDPNQAGRVKVRYPGLSSTDESAWARLLAVGGGSSRGTVFIPEVGDEVLVAFEGGDPRQPVVLGGLYGDKSAIPAWAVQDGKVTARGITSRLGHVMTLSDGSKPEDQFILLQLAGNQHTFKMSKKPQVDLTVPSGTPVNITAGSTKIAFADDGSISIEGLNVTIKAKEKFQVECLNGSVKASAQLALEASTQAGLKGATIQIEGSAMTAVKGGIVQIN
ncbi:MAG: VgrG-related protein [Acidimicrobiales bacterium]